MQTTKQANLEETTRFLTFRKVGAPPVWTRWSAQCLQWGVGGQPTLSRRSASVKSREQAKIRRSARFARRSAYCKFQHSSNTIFLVLHPKIHQSTRCFSNSKVPQCCFKHRDQTPINFIKPQSKFNIPPCS